MRPSAPAEEKPWFDLRLHQHALQLRQHIDYTPQLIGQDEYGYGVITGVESGIPRRLAQPAATTCTEMTVEHGSPERLYLAPQTTHDHQEF